jgi:type II secretory pathway pseudopilin PulG
MRDRRGSALLEVVVATLVLSVAGLAGTVSVSEALRATDRARAADLEAARADAFLDAVALWPREDLDRRLGDRAQGEWRLLIGRPEPELYVVTLADSTAARREILRTVLFRPDTADAPR